MDIKIKKLFLVYAKSPGGNIKHHHHYQVMILMPKSQANPFQSLTNFEDEYYNKHTVQYDPSRSV